MYLQDLNIFPLKQCNENTIIYFPYKQPFI